MKSLQQETVAYANLFWNHQSRMRDDEYAQMILEVLPKSMRAIRVKMRGAIHSDCTIPQFRIMNQLSKRPATNGELADWMGVSAPTMSRIVDTMVKQNLIQRVGESLDRRRFQLTLTALGKEKFDVIAVAVRHNLTQRLSELPTEVKQNLASGLSVLKEMFE